MERLQITSGEAKIAKEYRSWIEIETKEGKRLAETKFYGGKTCVGREEAEANAKLYVDAHNTYNEYSKLPSELLSENKELLEFANWVKMSMPLHSTMYNKANELITKIKSNG